MKKAAALFAVVLAVGMSLALDAEARRLGGARSSGMQRQAVTAPATPPAGTAQRAPTQAAPATAPAAGTAAAAAPKRSWMGPIAGLAAGLGIAALASHFGFGEALANMLTIALIAMAVLALIGFVMRKRAAAQGAPFGGAAAGGPSGMFRTGEPQQQPHAQPQGGSLIGSRIGSGLAAPAVGGPVPAGFDVEGFVRKAKTQFLLLQAANDAGDLERLRDYLTPAMFDIVRGEVESRPADAVQRTEVFGLEAQVLEAVEEPAQYVVSVRFTGSVREQPGAVPEDLDEVWHLTKPRAGAGGWVIAGIQQAA